MNNPFLSVVIPTFNRRDSLALTLRGLGAQTYPADDFEVIIVSDGSTDGTAEMLAEAALNCPYTLRWYTQANGGPSRARNRGVEEARGEVIVFTDDDMEPQPGFLEAHARHHATGANVVIIGPMSPDPARRDAEPVWIAWEHAMLEKQYEAFRTGKWQTAGPHNFYSGNASVRRELLLAVGGFDPSFTRQEDVELAFRMWRYSRPGFLFEPEALGLHRPLRKFDGWRAVPSAYGRLDVTRGLRTGDKDAWETVRHSYHARNRGTRALAQMTISCPTLLEPLSTVLRSAAEIGWRLRWRSGALASLSALYNVLYIHAALETIGSARELRRLLFQGVPPIIEADARPPADSPQIGRMHS